MRKYALALVLGPLLAGFAPAPKPKDDAKSELKKLQGAWYLVDIARPPDVKTALKDTAPQKAVVEGDRWAYHYESGPRATPFTVTLDPKTRPKSFTFTRGDRVVFRGIYALDGKGLKISYFVKDKETRPKDFPATVGDQITITFVRRKP